MVSDVKKQGYKHGLNINQLKDDLNKEIKTRTNENETLEKMIK